MRSIGNAENAYLTDFPHLILDFFSATFATRLTKFARFRDSHRLAPACGRYADDG